MDPWRNFSTLSKDQFITLQNQKLEQFINKQLYPFSSYYRELFDKNNINPKSIRTAEDLRQIPFTSKLDFYSKERQDQFRAFIIAPDEEKIKKYWSKSKLLSMAATKLFKGEEFLRDKLAKEFRPVFMTYTTGTTNKPVPFVYSNYDIQNLNLSGSRMLKLFDIKEDEYIVSLFPFAPHLAFWQVVFGGFASNQLILSTGGGKSIGTDGNVTALERMRPSVIVGVPSYIYHVLRVAQERGCKLDSINKVVLGASRVTSAFKKKLVDLLKEMGAKNVCVFGTYGFTEARCAWGECPTTYDVSSGYHLYPDKEIIEIIDPETGVVKGEGEDGELVYTSLDSRASAVIRYRTGDFIRGGITYEPCPHCGRTIPRISSDITRLSNLKDLQLSKIKGSLVNFNNFDATLSELPDLEEWQIEIKKKNDDPYEVDELFVYASAKQGCDENQLRENIERKIMLTTEVKPNNIYFIALEEMLKRLELETANKEKRIIDNRPKDQ